MLSRSFTKSSEKSCFSSAFCCAFSKSFRLAKNLHILHFRIIQCLSFHHVLQQFIHCAPAFVFLFFRQTFKLLLVEFLHFFCIIFALYPSGLHYICRGIPSNFHLSGCMHREGSRMPPLWHRSFHVLYFP